MDDGRESKMASGKRNVASAQSASSLFLCCSKYDALGMKQVLPFPHQEGIGRIDFLQPEDLPVANGFQGRISGVGIHGW